MGKKERVETACRDCGINLIQPSSRGRPRIFCFKCKPVKSRSVGRRTCKNCGEAFARWEPYRRRCKTCQTDCCIDCGKQITQGSKRCHPCAGKERWKRGIYDDIQVNSTTRNKMSKNAKARWARGDFDGLSEAVKAAHTRGAYDGVFQSPTTIELELSSALDICGIEHQPQYRPDGYRCVYDEFVPPNILIEAHGDYWHGPEKPEQQTRDTEKAAWAQENSYSLVVMWEHEIRNQGAWSLVVERVLPLVGEGKQCVASS